MRSFWGICYLVLLLGPLLGLHVAKFWGIDDLDLCQRNVPLSTLSVVSPRGRL